MITCPSRDLRAALILWSVVIAAGWQATVSAERRIEVAADASDPLAKEISLSPRASRKEHGPADRPREPHGRTLTTLAGGLAICLGGVLLLAWATRRKVSGGSARLPEEVVEPLGSVTIAGRQSLQLIRLGRKLVLLCVTPQGASAIAEVDDADEAMRLAGLCREAQPRSVSATFRDVLNGFDRESPEIDALDRARASQVPGHAGSAANFS